MPDQLQLFPSILKSILLTANSPKNAWWKLEIIEHNGKYYIRKLSGIPGHVLDRRIWPMESYVEAEKEYYRKIKAKLNPKRKSPRKYTLTCCNN